MGTDWAALRRAAKPAAASLGHSYIPALLVALLTLPHRDAVLATVGFVMWAKLGLAWRRPSTDCGEHFRGPDVYSTPSGHAVFASVLAFTIENTLARAYALSLAGSRIVLGVHDLFDVLSGWVIGALIAQSPDVWSTWLLRAVTWSGIALWALDVRVMPAEIARVFDQAAVAAQVMMQDAVAMLGRLSA